MKKLTNNTTSKNKRLSVFKLIQIMTAVLFILLFLFITAIIINYNYIIEKLLQRNVHIEKFTFNIKNQSIELSDFDFRDLNKKSLFKAKHVSLSFDIFKTITFRPTIKSILLENPETHIIKNKAIYQLPYYFGTQNGLLNNKKIPFKFTINEIIVTGGKIKLLENKQLSNFISDITIKLPAISTETNKITPEITGKINNKLFSFKGISKFGQNKEVSNIFNVSITGLDLVSDKLIIPVMPGFTLDAGIIDINAQLRYDISQSKKTSISVNGTLKARNLTVSDETGNKIIQRLNGSIKVSHYDISGGNILIDNLSVNSGIFTFPAITKKNKLFKAHIKTLTFKTLDFNYDDIAIKNASGTIKETGSDMSRSIFDIQGAIQNTGTFKFKAENKIDTLNITRLSLNSINPLLIKQFSAIKKIDSLFINRFNGYGTISQKDLNISGEGVFENLTIKEDAFSVEIPSIKFDIVNFDNKAQSVSVKKVIVSNATFKNKSDLDISKINLSLGDGISEIKVPLSSQFVFENTIPVSNLSFSHNSWGYPYNAFIENTKLTTSLKTDKKGISGSAQFLTQSIKIVNNKGVDGLIINKIAGTIDTITTEPFTINCDTISSEYMYARMDIASNMNILFGGIINPDSLTGETTENKYFHLANLNITDGNLALFDNHLTNPLFFDFSGINLNIHNFPSYIYPTGTLSLSGKVDAINPFSMNIKLSKKEITGDFKGKDFLLFRTSPYLEHYLGHSISSGRLDIDVPFTTNNAVTTMNIAISMKNPVIQKINSSLPIDLYKVFNSIQEKDGTVKLNLPVELKKDKTKVDFFAVIFEIMQKTLKITADKFINPTSSEIIKYNPTYSIVYFSNGTSNINDTEILDDTMKQNITNKNYIFSISSFIEKKNDSEYIKRNIIKRFEKKYQNLSKTELYRSIAIKDYNLDISENTSDDDIFGTLLERTEVKQEDFFALSYERSESIKQLLISRYKVPENRIFIEETDIFSNPYISGISNAIGIIRTGTIKN
ncbi:MAG: hypothetical protein A2015_00575 [Spirochaetes bacterium GWF1_31_7]|nr:MAG: hypothetical protein A2Y30_03935 [Spirochaetes bacterium GWE1_32_154]OHD45167.1 MAG: hypothetical protein A2Y29_15960 [Spirochaetes bacterium GWE2_31_10]OHD51077.1 MAG: hypothetical protein A2015_00575 [Spirochaetes bacterium GWF1_31_7]OHD80598.1 MAG: hypothetical protein A2355_07695 [Spirochaetes bacterium RIFOXYB1_FULL_32_8]